MLSRTLLGWLAPRFVHRCSFSVAASRSAPMDDLAPSSLPSREFLKNNVSTAVEKERLTSVVSEIEMYKEFHGPHSIPDLTDQQWASLIAIKYPDERCNFLAALHYDNNKGSNIIKESVTYEPYEYQLIDLRGQDLRRQMDVMYGSRLWSDQRCGSGDLPRLIVDARFLATYSAKSQPLFTRSVQELHDLNWSSPNPFHISIANYRPDAQLSELIKRHWFFLYGPPAESVNASSFRVHPFSPNVSPRPVRSLLSGVDKDDILFISPKARRFLPDKPPANIKAVVLSLTSDAHHYTSSSTAAVAEGLTPYRIPIEKHLNLSNASSRSPPIWEMAATLRGWFRGQEWSDAIKENIVVRRKKMMSLAQGTKSDSFLAFRSAVLNMNNAVLERKRKDEKREKRESREGKKWMNRTEWRRRFN